VSTGAPATECTVPGYRVTVVEKNGLLVRFSAHPQPAPQCVGEAHWLPAGGGWAARRDPEGNVHAVHNALFYEAGTEYVTYRPVRVYKYLTSTTGYKVAF
jgi:hypothetical protein